MFRLPAFLAASPRLAFFTLAATAASGFGQTFFVSIFGGEIREGFGLSHTAYGSLYSAATLLSAALLLRYGSLVDRWSLPRVTALAIVILASGCLLVGLAPSAILLGVGFLGIRFGGQGMVSHVGMTTAARYFSAQRGKAVAMAAAGFPLAEAVLPASAALLLGWVGWRLPWVASAAILVVLVLPLLTWLSRNAPPLGEILDNQRGDSQSGLVINHFTRAQVLRDPGFYLILPATLITPFIITALFFHQIALASELDWTLRMLGAGFSLYAVCHLASLLAAGILVDRLTAGVALPLALVPVIIGLIGLAFLPPAVALFVYMGLLGVAHGSTSTAGNSIWAERYGILHLGAIRSMNQAVMVVATAVAPILLGFLLDQEVGVPVLAASLAALAAIAAFTARIGSTRDGKRARAAGD